jgi:hypothetical protein
VKQNIITSKEQEKDLKAYTCKNCGSTIFIAKTREVSPQDGVVVFFFGWHPKKHMITANSLLFFFLSHTLDI